MESIGVVNSACPIALERIGRLDILQANFTQIFIPVEVQNEIGVTADWLRVKIVNDRNLVAALFTRMDLGEAAAIALAIEIGDATVVLDDRRARSVAKALDIPVIGTLGLVLQAKRKGIVASVMPILEDLDRVGFRMSKDLMTMALLKAKEDTGSLDRRE